MDEGRFDAAIVGYGPVGAMTALQLADAGLRVVILERGTELMDIPRAVGIDGEAMRAFQRLGLAERVEAVVQPRREHEEFCFTDSKRTKLFGMSFPPVGPTGWRDIAFFDQPELEALMREIVAERRDSIDVREGLEVTRVEQRDEGVVVSGRTAEGEVSVRASWVIGCDGASSFVRRSIGSKWESLGYDQDWLVVDVTIGPDADLPDAMMQVCDPERLTTYIPGRDPYRRWEFQIVDGDAREEMTRPDRIEALLAPWLPPAHYEIRRAAVYQFHAATATEWRHGRVLLAGDAAHQTPPFLGQGLNSGFRDAVCLGWKLPLVASGACDASLLDTYQAERGAHASDLVDRAVGIGQLMETLAAREAGRPDPYEAAANRAAPPSQGEIVPGIRGGTLVAEQLRDGGPVGRLLHQPRVRGSSGEVDRLDALLGTGFAAVGRTRADLAVSERGRAVAEALGLRFVALDELEVVDGAIDPLFETHAAAVLRPDRIVFGVVDERIDLDGLLAALESALALRHD